MKLTHPQEIPNLVEKSVHKLFQTNIRLAQSEMGTKKKQHSDSNLQLLSCLYASSIFPLNVKPLVSKGLSPYNVLHLVSTQQITNK